MIVRFVNEPGIWGNYFGMFDSVNSTEIDDVPRFVENPEWRKKNIEKQISDRKDSIEVLEARLVELNKDIESLKKEL